jgi:hypothetical protein
VLLHLRIHHAGAVTVTVTQIQMISVRASLAVAASA